MTAKDQFAAHVGLDWADKKHDVCVQFKNGDRIFHVIEHTPEALDIWLNELHQRGAPQKTESMVTPVFATPILTISWLA